MTPEKAKKLLTFAKDPQQAIFEELQQLTEQTHKISLEGAEIVTIKGAKGDRGEKPTKDEIIEIVTPIIKENIPDPIKPKDGIDGRNPMYTGKLAPNNPQIGDLWYQD